MALGAIVLACGLALTACGSDSSGDTPELKVEGAFIPEPASDDMAAGFFLVRNGGGADTLSSVSSDIAGQVTLHTTEDGVMKEQDSFAVPANGELDFERGANHLMFENLKRKPKEGEKVSLELHFTKSGPMKVEMPVKSPTYQPTAATKSSTQSSSTSDH